MYSPHRWYGSMHGHHGHDRRVAQHEFEVVPVCISGVLILSLCMHDAHELYLHTCSVLHKKMRLVHHDEQYRSGREKRRKGMAAPPVDGRVCAVSFVSFKFRGV